jgi:hypothetical protein
MPSQTQGAAFEEFEPSSIMAVMSFSGARPMNLGGIRSRLVDQTHSWFALAEQVCVRSTAMTRASENLGAVIFEMGADMATTDESMT